MLLRWAWRLASDGDTVPVVLPLTCRTWSFVPYQEGGERSAFMWGPQCTFLVLHPLPEGTWTSVLSGEPGWLTLLMTSSHSN